MRLLVSALLSFLALSSVSADGTGKFNSAAAAKQANTDRQNTIAITSTQGVAIQSRSLTYTAAVNGSMPITSYDEVDIVTGIFPDDKRTGKVEIQIDNLNVTQTGMGKKSNLQVQEFAFAFRPYSIVQYVETNAVPNGFDVNDTLCNEYQVRPGLTTASQFVFKAVSVNVTQAANATAGTTTITNFEGISADKVLKIVLHAPGAVGTNTAANMAKSVWINGRFVSPTSIKFDVVIDVNQPGFKLNTSAACTNYSIAIKSWTRSMQDIWAHTTTQTTVNGTTTTTTTTTNLDRIQTGGNANPFGFFTWATTATVTTLNSTTTATSQVLATSLLKVDNKEDHDNLGITKEAVHSFIAIRPGVIAWDPEFGSDSANPDIADAVSNSTSAPTDAPSGATTAPPSGNTTNAPTTPAGKNIASTTSFSIVSIIAVVMVALFGQ